MKTSSKSQVLPPDHMRRMRGGDGFVARVPVNSPKLNLDGVFEDPGVAWAKYQSIRDGAIRADQLADIITTVTFPPAIP